MTAAQFQPAALLEITFHGGTVMRRWMPIHHAHQLGAAVADVASVRYAHVIPGEAP